MNKYQEAYLEIVYMLLKVNATIPAYYNITLLINELLLNIKEDMILLNDRSEDNYIELSLLNSEKVNYIISEMEQVIYFLENNVELTKDSSLNHAISEKFKMGLSKDEINTIIFQFKNGISILNRMI